MRHNGRHGFQTLHPCVDYFNEWIARQDEGTKDDTYDSRKRDEKEDGVLACREGWKLWDRTEDIRVARHVRHYCHVYGVKEYGSDKYVWRRGSRFWNHATCKLWYVYIYLVITRFLWFFFLKSSLKKNWNLICFKLSIKFDNKILAKGFKWRRFEQVIFYNFQNL